MNNAEQQFLNELDNKFWKAADKLRANMDAANYKHVVLGLIFLKYVSDAFEARQQELITLFRDVGNPDNIYAMSREDYESDEEYAQAIADELEVEDYYTEKNIFWVPKAARWDTLKNKAMLPTGTVLWVDETTGQDVKLRSVSWLVDNALDEIEKTNPKLKGILNRISQYQLGNEVLTGLINTFSDANFSNPEYNGEKLNLKSKDILGHVYEYFLGQFALAEGKQGGQYYTPKSIVTLIVEMLQPYNGRVYDPAMGSGGFFVSSDRFIEEHAGEKQYNAAEQKQRISVYGQESNPTTWKLAAMNMAIRGIDFNFGSKNADTLLDDQHPDLRADFVMANPPFNMKEWWSAKLENDVRWKYGTPPQGNANFAWMQHMIHHLAPKGSMALLLANGSMSSNTNNEGEIRRNLIEADLVECMVALPGQLFTNTQIPACIWFLTKDKTGGNGKAHRKGEVLFIDARQIGYMKDRVLRDFTREDIAKIAETFHAWQADKDYEDEAGFCFSATLEDIQKNDFVLTPGRYVGAAEQDEDDESFAEKMSRLTAQLKDQLEESAKLEAQIKANLGGWVMSSEWSVKKLGDLVTFLSGGTPSKSNKDYWDGEIPWISASSMQSTRYHDSDLRVTTLGSTNGTRPVPAGTVLLLVRGGALHNKIPVGITTREVTFNQDVKALVPKSEDITPYYLLAWLISSRELLLGKVENTGIGAGKLDTKILHDLDVPLPPKAELLRLELFSKALDDKIILNQNINKTLEQIAQALFKSWFVDFEPVKAKMAVLEAGGSQEDATLAAMTVISGKEVDALVVFSREHPEQYAELKVTAELFPSAMQDGELGRFR